MDQAPRCRTRGVAKLEAAKFDRRSDEYKALAERWAAPYAAIASPKPRQSSLGGSALSAKRGGHFLLPWPGWPPATAILLRCRSTNQ